MNSIFQQQEFYKFLESSGILEPFRFSVSRDNLEVGVIQGFIQSDGGRLKRFLSRRAIINGGPFLAVDITDDEVETLLQNCIKGLKRKAIYIEFRNYFDFSKYQTLFEKMEFLYEPHYDIIVNVDGEEPWEKRMESSRTRFVKSSLKNGAEIVANPSEQDVVDYYKVLKYLYTEKVKTPLFPLEFFLKLYHTSFCKYIIVKYNDAVVGGLVCVFDENAAYEWFVCGIDGVYKHVYPSTMATYYAIKFASEKGLKYFDMMGAGAPSDGGYGVREFKMRFGGELVEYGRFKYICNPLLYKIGSLGVKLLKRH